MERDAYVVKTVIAVFERLGYSVWKQTPNFILLNHTKFNSELIFDTVFDIIPHTYMQFKLKSICFKEELFDSMYNNEVSSRE